jgi:uncharacterized protein (TIGR03083 family)
MSDADAWIAVLRSSHDQLAAAVATLSDDEVAGQSYDTDWSIADVASHLGSQAEIFELFLEAGLTGGDPPGGDAFGPIWDRWNALAPAEKVSRSVAANEAFVARLEALSDDAKDSFSLAVFGMQADLPTMLSMRLGEFALHRWDIEVALDSSALVDAGSVDVLINTIAANAARFGKPAASPRAVVIETTAPARRFAMTTGPEVAFTADSTSGDADLTLPAEALLRAVYGRLDPDHTPGSLSDNELVGHLREVFPGF